MRFWKYQAHGNDYLVLDAAEGPPPSAEAVRRICDRHTGVGADGVLYGPEIRDGAFGLRIFNPDGGEAEKSGNGIRIFARWLKDTGLATGESGWIATAGGEVEFRYLDAEGNRIEAAMGVVSFWSDDIPMTGPRREVVGEELEFEDSDGFAVTCLTIGNPHCVVLADQARAEDAQNYGPRIERHASFPNRTNMQMLEVVNRATIRIEIWERGAGYTQASGSSSCAAACAAHRLGLVDANVHVEMPGGAMDVAISPDWTVKLTGEASPVFMGKLAPGFLRD
ncbi:MAG: diaminopimelate epimerase [Alphaproteobacteria bacterium]